ncbi:MAG: glycosyltransferase [Timaviella obliquedivisa GSE-PSE-MK23-08B]|jgi:glycosyltransferase involved in cell wall biosynthesis|nr:glycosyltransferase [Timaviella obliquedivisa GSE-PSE-MK23-08B]
MSFPSDQYWTQALAFLQHQLKPSNTLLAPNDFLELFSGTYPYRVSHLFPAHFYNFVVFHKDMVAEVDQSLSLKVLEHFYLSFANDVFVIYAQAKLTDIPEPDERQAQALVEQIEASDRFESLQNNQTCAIVVTTYNNPDNLARSLPQIAALGAPVLIIDDGSSPEQAAQNQNIAEQYGVQLMRSPTHQRQPNAINLGISHWLADPTIAWISYFRDNVNVRADALTVLAQIQSPERPILTGRDAPEHPTLQTDIIADHPILLKRSSSSIHFHAHRRYWASILPIPTPVLDLPGQGTDEDWWITAWSPYSIVKQGGNLVCVPGLVNTFEDAESLTGKNPAGRSPTEATPSVAPTLPIDLSPKKIGETSSVRYPQERAPIVPETVLPAIAPANINSEDLSLAGVKVLVDGYNLQLPQGTGIKTYGLSLIQALNEMGATVDVLLGRGGYKGNEILDEVYFFDTIDKDQNLLMLLKGLLKTAAGPLYRAKRRKPSNNYVVKRGQYSDDFLKYATSFNLPQCYDLANGIYKKLNITTHISASEKLDIWHATYPLPMKIRGTQKITTVHDLIPLRLPYATLDDKENFYFKVRDALKESAVTITVSEHSKQDLLTYFDVDPDRIVVTYQPIALQPLPVSKEEVAFSIRRFGLSYQNYLLFVGAIEPKKNVGRLLDAYAALNTDMPLVIVGKKGWLWENEIGKLSYLFDSDSSKQVRLLEYVSPDSLRYLYRGAYCLVFPSLYEGFGLPPIEAMNFGCPVVTSNASCLPEVCGNAALYVDPYDVRDIKAKLEEILGDKALRDRLAIAGRQVAKNFSMENYLKRLHSAYVKALG